MKEEPSYILMYIRFNNYHLKTDWVHHKIFCKIDKSMSTYKHSPIMSVFIGHQFGGTYML